MVMLAALQANAREGAHGSLAAIFDVLGAIQKRQLDVLCRAGPRQQIELLENEADLLIPDLGKLIAIERPDVHALQPVGPGCRFVAATPTVHEGGLARA